MSYEDAEIRLSIGQCATLACILEATAPKVGNVHRGADFEDVGYVDFLVSAVVIGPIIESAAERGVGRTVLEAVRATRAAVGTNTNLGTVLLLAPLSVAATNVGRDWDAAVADVMARLTPDDARCVYEAIRLAHPGGLGNVERCDVSEPPPNDLLMAMRLAADRDMVARQYAEKFRHVLHEVVPWLREELANHSLMDAIVRTQLRVLSAHPDSLIARKCGPIVAQETAARAAEALRRSEVEVWKSELDALADFDFWLRSDGHRRNPGTTADLIAAGLFVAIVSGYLSISAQFPASAG